MEELFPNLDVAELRLTGLLCLSGLVTLAGLYVLGRILTRKRHDSAIPLLMVVGGVVAIVAGISLFLDTRPTVPGVVLSRRETVETRPDGNGDYHFRLNVRYTPAGETAPRSDELSADQETYDSLRAGDAVQVRFWDAGGFFEFARLRQRSTAGIVWQSGALYYAAVLLLGLLLGWLVGMARDNRAMGLVYGMVAVVAAIFSMQAIEQWLLLLPLGGPQATAVAEVRAVRTYTELRRDEDDSSETPLLQPFDLVEVAFVPAGWSDPVVALDRVDAGSLPLELGGTVAIVYRTDRPRAIRLQGGERTFLWKNPVGSALMLGAIILVGLYLVFGRRRLSRWLPPRPEWQNGDRRES